MYYAISDIKEVQNEKLEYDYNFIYNFITCFLVEYNDEN